LYQTKRYLGVHPLSQEYLVVLAIGAVFAIWSFGVSLLNFDVPMRVVLVGAGSLGYVALTWSFAISEEDRSIFRTLVD
jgi:uncharacterized YccA/Bax inhibitor family protein